AIDLLDHVLDLVEVRLRARLTVDNQDKMVAKGRLDDIAHLNRLEVKGGLGERFYHAATAGKPANVTAVFLGGTGRFLSGKVAERFFEHLDPLFLASQVFRVGRQLGQLAGDAAVDILLDLQQVSLFPFVGLLVVGRNSSKDMTGPYHGAVEHVTVV